MELAAQVQSRSRVAPDGPNQDPVARVTSGLFGPLVGILRGTDHADHCGLAPTQAYFHRTYRDAYPAGLSITASDTRAHRAEANSRGGGWRHSRVHPYH